MMDTRRVYPLPVVKCLLESVASPGTNLFTGHTIPQGTGATEDYGKVPGSPLLLTLTHLTTEGRMTLSRIFPPRAELLLT